MRAQILLTDGPFDMHLISYSTHDAEFPAELRVGSYSEFVAVEEEDFHAAVYRRREVEDAPVSLMKFGAYDFTDMRPTRKSLVDVWVN